MTSPVQEALTLFLHEGQHYVWFQQFIDFLQRGSTHTTPPSIVDRAFQSYRDGICSIDGNRAVSVTGIVRYVFHRAEKNSACEDLSKQIVNYLTKQHPKQKSLGVSQAESVTSYDLYKEIEKDVPIASLIASQCSHIEEEKLSTLVECHKENFSKEVWHQICIFEHHFIQVWQPQEETVRKKWPDQDEYVKRITEAKWKFWKQCQHAKNLGIELVEQSRNTISRRSNRKIIAEFFEKPTISASQKHNPNKLDEELFAILQQRFPGTFKRVATFDTETSKSTNMIDVAIELMAATDRHIEHCTSCVSRFLINKHHTLCSHVFFLQPGSLDTFCQTGVMARFSLRDTIMQGYFHKNVVKCAQPSQDMHALLAQLDPEDTDSECTCKACFTDQCDLLPLSFNTFDIFTEWILDVPLQFQLLLWPFIDTRSFRISPDKDKFLKRKMKCLYSVYDTILHTYNKTHFGILQEANTDELMIGYKCINTLFDVTSASGATMSLDKAEQRLKAKADKDLLYFMAYLKEYLLKYYTDAGLEKVWIRLRDCHLNLMLDNLVRQKINDDPKRGDCRSKQLNLLPISLQGIPRNAAVTKLWHDPAICDDTENCQCKKERILKKEDIMSTLHECSTAEASVSSRYSLLCTWGITDVLREALQHGKYAKGSFYPNFNPNINYVFIVCTFHHICVTLYHTHSQIISVINTLQQPVPSIMHMVDAAYNKVAKGMKTLNLLHC